MKRWAFCLPAGLLLAAVAPAVPVAAATPTTIELVSGGAAIGSADPETDLSVDGGLTFQDATVVAPHYLYDVLPGTGWISTPAGGVDRQYWNTLFRRTFTLPGTATGGGLTVCVHTDNYVRISLNGLPIGAQPTAEDAVNFQDPAECFVGVPVAGVNVLDFDVRNESYLMGLDYRAVVTYSERVNTPPQLSVPEDLTVNATTPSGATVTFTATATDDGVAAPTVSCTPSSGSTVPIGTTTVSCTARDDEGAETSGSFAVTVRGAREQLADLLVAVSGAAPGSSLPAKIRAAVAVLPDRSLPMTCEPLRAFVSEVRAQSGKRISEATAAGLIADATRIRAVLACP